MKIRILKTLFVSLLLIAISACNKPTYPKEKVTQSIIKLCKDEYNLDVGVKTIGSTIGVVVAIEGLVDLNLRLDEGAREKIEDVALSIHRVTMSTDRHLKFYTLTARDVNTVGAEFVLTGATYDVLRVQLLDISRGEYHKRILRDFRFNPVVIGDAKIKELFKALNENSPLIQAIKQPIFYPIYTIGKEGSQKIEIVETLSKETSNQEALFYVKTREYYEILPGLEAYTAIFPPGFNNEYLILVNMSMFPNPIKEIVSRYFYSGTEIKERDLKETFDQYKDTGYVGIDGFPKWDLDLGWFLSRQIAERVKTMFEEDKRLNKNFAVQASHGSIDNKIFRFSFSIISSKPSNEDDEVIFSNILKLITTVLHRYEFKDFEGVELTDINAGGKKIYLSKVDLERFRRNKIRVKDIIQP